MKSGKNRSLGMKGCNVKSKGRSLVHQRILCLFSFWSNFRIPRNSFTCHWIRIASIVLCLDLQSLPTHVSEADQSCGVFWSLALLFTPCPCVSTLSLILQYHYFSHKFRINVGLMVVFNLMENLIVYPKEFIG